ncbi:MAG: MFS transporter [Firmicutes bacterium]|nr:MFS transporter [Alicyclobacillaceae bacterium]MCL6498242.1 MFS transporter [Bacillota bacterium]
MSTPGEAVPGLAAAPSRRYVTTLVTLATLGVLLSAFDSVARNVALPLILQSLHMNIAEGGLVFSGGFLASFLSNLLVGPVIDRFGRKRAFLLTLLATALFSGITAFVTTVWEYAVVGFLAGTCLAVQEPAQVLVSEEAPARWRGTLMGIVGAGFAMGSIVVSLVGAAILPSGNWRMLFLLAFAPVLLVLLGAAFLREPPRSAEALRVKRERQRIASGQTVATTFAIDEVKAVQPEWVQIFAPDLRRQTLVTAIFGLLVNFSTGFVLALGVSYLTAFDHIGIGVASLAIAVEGLATLVGTILVGWLADRIAARHILVVWSMVGGIAVGLLAIRGGPSWVFFAMALFGFFGQGALGCWFRYLADSFPTRARGSGTGFVVGVFFFGLAFAPAIFGAVMNTGNFPGAALLAGGIAIAGALVLLAGKVIPPRKELEEIVI